MQPNKEERSLGELFVELSKQTGTLVRQEVELARVEMTHKAARVGKDIGFLAIGGAIAYAGFVALLAAVIFGLARLGLDLWLSALIVGLVVAVVGYFLVQRGLNALKREDLTPRQTIQTIKEDTTWAKEQIQ